MISTLKPPKRPCGSCPYVKTTPSGIWHKSEYEKLTAYDNPTALQPPQVFMCHQQDGHICGGWLMTHDADHLLALRLNNVDEGAFNYFPHGVDVHESGKAACDFGVTGIAHPSDAAKKKIAGLIKRRGLSNGQS